MSTIFPVVVVVVAAEFEFHTKNRLLLLDDDAVS